MKIYYVMITFKQIILFVVVWSCSFFAYAQKKPIDLSNLENWPSLGDFVAISNDGNFVQYDVKDNITNRKSLIVKSLKGDLKIELPEGKASSFTNDSRSIIYFGRDDTLFLRDLRIGIIKKKIPNVNTYKLIDRNESCELLAYSLKSKPEKLFLIDLSSEDSIEFSNTIKSLFSNDGKWLLLETAFNLDGKMLYELNLINLFDYAKSVIWKGSETTNLIFDEKNGQFAFKNTKDDSVWLYKIGANKLCSLKIKDADFDNRLRLDEITGFNNNGDLIFARLTETDSALKNDQVSYNIWSYRDTKLQSEQITENGQRCYYGAINISSSRACLVTKNNEQIIATTFNKKLGDIAIVLHKDGDGSSEENNWNPACKQSIFLVKEKDGVRIRLKEIGQSIPDISPDGRFLVFYNSKEKNFFSYQLETGALKNITKGIPNVFKRHNAEGLDEKSVSPRGIAGWTSDSEQVLIYDKYDIWQVFLTGNRRSINLTNGFGRKHHIIYDFLEMLQDTITKGGQNQRLLLSGFNLRTKGNGFFCKYLNKIGDPALLTMGAYIYNSGQSFFGTHGMIPIKALRQNIYVVKRMSATSSPNYYWTSDFKSFNQISNVTPEQQVNWLTTTLISWKTPKGRLSQGVLYKPENFDPKKKYPLIVYYYRILSDGLNEYIEPAMFDGRLNIPYLVSNGYLVFTPDIHFTIGNTGKCALNSVVSATKYLSMLKYVDRSRIGIQGHSFGGYETNFIVTHTGIFAAACSSSGVSDLISGYGSLSNSQSKAGQFEVGPYQIGATLWERPDLYLKNSPILTVNRVTTPILIMATPQDGAVPFSQAIEFFTALRRLGKKSWMLQYNDGNHTIFGKSALDFTIRLKQFFDYYLMQTPPPKWMTRSLPAKMIGNDDGLSLDMTGGIP